MQALDTLASDLEAFLSGLDGRKPTVPEVLPFVGALYKTPHGAVGCCLHIVLDDGNVEDGHVQFCIDYALAGGAWQHEGEGPHRHCAMLGQILLRMSKTQRSKLSLRAYG